MNSRYVVSYRSKDGRFELWHLNGVPWWEAPIPPRWHRCRPHTRGVDWMTLVERCACGALRIDGRGWAQRNSRRKDNGE